MKKDKKLNLFADFLASGAGLSLDAIYSNRYFGSYAPKDGWKTKDAAQLEGQPDLVIVASSFNHLLAERIANLPKAKIIMFANKAEGCKIPIWVRRRAYITSFVDGYEPLAMVRQIKNVLEKMYPRQFINADNRPKVLVCSDFSLLSAMVLGMLPQIDFYFADYVFPITGNKRAETIAAAYTAVMMLSKSKEALTLDSARLFVRPEEQTIVEVARSRFGCMNTDMIAFLGLSNEVDGAAIIERRTELGLFKPITAKRLALS